MIHTNPNLLPGQKGWIEKLSEVDVFEYYVTGWIKEYKEVSLIKDDVLSITKKVAKYRRDDSIVLQIEHRMGLFHTVL